MHIELQGFDDIQRRLGRYPPAAEAQLRNAMTTALLVLEADQRRHVAQDTRRLMSGITSRIEGSGPVLTGRVGPTVRYGLFVERGRRPGRRPPVAALAGWARRHGVNPFALARAIGRRGTRAQPFVEPSLERNRDQLRRIFERVGARLVAALAGP
jgi:hypothetical protein